jgi:uncharacterized membrane protein YqhA
MPDESTSTRPGTDQGRSATPLEAGAERALAASLQLVFIPVVILLLAALAAFVFGTVVFIDALRKIIEHPFPVGHQVGLFLLDIDLFLVGATLLIAAVGSCELFIREIHVGQATRVPAWLQMRDLNDLKGRVIGMIILVLSVSFVETAVDSPAGQQLLELGGGVALVIVALTVFLRLSGHPNDKN